MGGCARTLLSTHPIDACGIFFWHGLQCYNYTVVVWMKLIAINFYKAYPQHTVLVWLCSVQADAHLLCWQLLLLASLCFGSSNCLGGNTVHVQVQYMLTEATASSRIPQRTPYTLAYISALTGKSNVWDIPALVIMLDISLPDTWFVLYSFWSQHSDEINHKHAEMSELLAHT